MSEGNEPGCCMPSGDGRRSAAVAACAEAESGASRRAADYGSTEGMVRVEAGPFLMGTDSDEAWDSDGERPSQEVALDAFWISRTCVTNEEFAAFVEDTGYVTEAERFGWSYVFRILLPNKTRKRLRPANVQGLEWWYGVEGAYWRKPEGPGSNVKKRLDHPAIHVSWNDALAYCQWKGCRLPTEAEWEKAARGGLEGKLYAWGDELTPGGKHRCNIWQGKFPFENTGEDGYVGAAPARSFRANGFGLYNVAGNVWEWCADWFSPTWRQAHREPNPRGPEHGERRVMKGGSYLCHYSYCNRYRVAARTSNTPDTSTGNLGFRVARDA